MKKRTISRVCAFLLVFTMIAQLLVPLNVLAEGENYSVNFNVNGATGTPPNDITGISAGEYVHFPEPTDLTYPKHLFSGWEGGSVTYAVYEQGNASTEYLIEDILTDVGSSPAATVNAKWEPTYWINNIEEWTEGSGTVDDPYLISKPEHLGFISNTCVPRNSYIDKYFKLTTDLDMSEHYWTPISEFRGHLDGNGHVIRNLENSLDSYTYANISFINTLLNGGSISNLGLENVLFTGRSNVGALVAQTEGEITKCYTTGKVRVIENTCGGFVGTSTPSSKIKYSYADVDVENWGMSSSQTIGGFIGMNNGSIENCYSRGNMATHANYVGGFAGINCGPISYCYSTGTPTGHSYVNDDCGANSGAVTDCVVDLQTSGTGSAVAFMGTPTFEMKSQFTYTDLDMSWDFAGEIANGAEDIWTIDSNGIINDGYPYFYVSPVLEPVAFEGTGSETDPYLISEIGNLQYLTTTCAENEGYVYKYFKLTTDLDMSGYYWTPISQFMGQFDGNNHVIRNLRSNDASGVNVGFIGTLREMATVSHLGVEDVLFIGNNFVGGLVGNALGDITNCYATGTVKAVGNNIGGLVGVATGSSHINYSYADVAVENYDTTTPSYNIGGFIGLNNGSISNCYAKGTFSTHATAVGGFMGRNFGWIQQCYAVNLPVGEATVGGGLNSGSPDSVVDCYFDGDVSGIASSDSFNVRTSAEMKSKTSEINTTYSGWDFVGSDDGNYADIWEIDPDGVINNGYPYIVGPYIYNAVHPNGTGIESDPYLISSVENIMWMQENLTDASVSADELYFKQTNDIDLGPIDNFTPIGFVSADDPIVGFKGVYDGDNYTLSNLDIDWEDDNIVSYVGFFAIVKGGTVKNIRFDDVQVDVTGETPIVGVVAGRLMNNGVIQGIQVLPAVNITYVNVTAENLGEVGGIVGLCERSTIKYCNNEAHITCDIGFGFDGSSSYIGGIVGYSVNSTIHDCESNGLISGGGDTISEVARIGGIAGEIEISNVRDCVSSCNFGEPSSHNGEVVGMLNANSTLSNCYALDRGFEVIFGGDATGVMTNVNSFNDTELQDASSYSNLNPYFWKYPKDEYAQLNFPIDYAGYANSRLLEASTLLDYADITFFTGDTYNTITKNFELPDSMLDGEVTVSWAEQTDSPCLTISGATGNVTRPLCFESDASITLIATLSMEDGMPLTKPFDIKILKLKDAKVIIPSTFTAIYGTHTNLLTYLNSLTGMSDADVTLTLDSLNDNVADDGTITYTNTEVSGNVYVDIKDRRNVVDFKTVAVTIPSYISPTNQAINDAIALLPSNFSAVRGTHANLLTYLNSISGMSDTGVTLTLNSSNDNVSNTGFITYTETEVVGDVVVYVNKDGGTEQSKSISVTVPLYVSPINEDISDAIDLLPTEFTAIYGTHTNLLTYLNALAGMDDTGVTLTLDSSNGNVTNTGAITYTETETTGNVVVHVNKAGGTEQTKTIEVTVPAHHTFTDDEIAIGVVGDTLPNSFTAIRGTHTNFLTYLNSLPTVVANGVTLTLASSNANVANNGAITYTSTAVTANVNVTVSKGSATPFTKPISVTIPAYNPPTNNDNDNGGSSGGSSTPSAPPVPPAPPAPLVNVGVNGQPQNNMGTGSQQMVNGVPVTIISLNAGGLTPQFDNMPPVGGNVLTMSAPIPSSGVLVGQLTGDVVKAMENREAVLEIRTDNVTYTLPAGQINIDNVSRQLGTNVQLSDIQVNISVGTPPMNTSAIVSSVANSNGYGLVSAPVEFNITCTYQGRVVDVSRFNGYVGRTIALPSGIDPSRITTGIVLNQNGSFSHVPTVVEFIGGGYYASINSLTNSIYSVIWNPVTFKDVENHWVKNIANDLGSRLVVTGDSNGNFNPDTNITRAEFTTIVVKALGLQPGTGVTSFKDVKSIDKYAPYIETASQYGIVTGYNGMFNPDALISRAEAMTIIDRMMKITKYDISVSEADTKELLAKYTDFTKGSSWAEDSVLKCLKSGIMVGKGNNTVELRGNITNAEAAALIQRLLIRSKLINE